jgi:glucose/arabinose dehydrogenase
MKFLRLMLKLSLGLILALLIVAGGLVAFMPGIHLSSIGMILNVMTGASGDTPEEELLQRLQAADGYRVSIFARDIANPRMLFRTRAGRLLVSSPRSGEVLQLTDTDGDGAADLTEVLLSGLRRPHGLEMHAGKLYVAESNQIGRIDYNPESGEVRGEYSVLVGNLTDDGNHWSKTVRFDDKGDMYVAMGSTCNVCEETDSRRATIMRYDTATGEGRVYASGLRNSVGMAFAPWDGALYATDNGRDLLGDDYPPCELNRIEKGSFYGWPYLNGNNKLDPDFGAGKEAVQAYALPPVFSFRAHNAPLGIYFPHGDDKSALVALHGSWNRSTPDGYRVLKLIWLADDSITSSDFMWGFEQDGDIVGRPVDITGDGAGGYFVSDDYARVIYRLSRDTELQSATATASAEIAAPAAPVIDAGLASAGEELYNNMPCADCHAATALTPVRLSKLEERYSVAQLTEYFVTPTPPMPRYELSLEQRSQLAHYLLSRDQSAEGM